MALAVGQGDLRGSCAGEGGTPSSANPDPQAVQKTGAARGPGMTVCHVLRGHRRITVGEDQAPRGRALATFLWTWVAIRSGPQLHQTPRVPEVAAPFPLAVIPGVKPSDQGASGGESGPPGSSGSGRAWPHGPCRRPPAAIGSPAGRLSRNEGVPPRLLGWPENERSAGTSRSSRAIGASEQAASRQTTTAHLSVRVLLQKGPPSFLAQRDAETTLTAPQGSIRRNLQTASGESRWMYPDGSIPPIRHLPPWPRRERTAKQCDCCQRATQPSASTLGHGSLASPSRMAMRTSTTDGQGTHAQLRVLDNLPPKPERFLFGPFPSKSFLEVSSGAGLKAERSRSSRERGSLSLGAVHGDAC